MVGLVENALIEIKDRFTPDRIIIESRSAHPPPSLLSSSAQWIRFSGYFGIADPPTRTSRLQTRWRDHCNRLSEFPRIRRYLTFCQGGFALPSTASSCTDDFLIQLQAKYTDMLLLSKHQLVSERGLDILMDHLGTLNDTTPRIRVSKEEPAPPSVVFGLDTSLFLKEAEEGAEWTKIGGEGSWHGDEVETRTVWRGGVKPGSNQKRKRDHDHSQENTNGSCDCDEEPEEGDPVVEDRHSGEVEPIDRAQLESLLEKQSFEIYRSELRRIDLH